MMGKVKYLEVLGIDGKSVSNSLLVHTGKGSSRWLTFAVAIYGRSIVGFTSVPTVSVGTNSATYNNIFAATALTGLDVTDESLWWPLTGISVSVPPDTDIFCRVSVAAVATTYLFDAVLIGLNR